MTPGRHALFLVTMVLGTLLTMLAIAAAYYTWRALADPFPHLAIRFMGDFPASRDDELGFAGRVEGRTHWIDPRSGLDFHMYTDRRRARVDRPGEETPLEVELMTLGGSFAFGYGVENEQTFTSILTRLTEIGTAANLAYPSYGTVQALQVWRRNRALHPRYVIYAIIEDHLRRNLSPCAPSISAYCLPVAYVAWDRATGAPSIAPAPLERSMPAERLRDFLTEVVFTDRIGPADVLWKARMDLHHAAALDDFRFEDTPARRQAAASFLLGALAKEVSAAGARLLVVYIPQTDRRGTLAAPSDALLGALAGKPLSFLDLTPEMARYQQVAGRPPLFIPGNWHPAPAGHRLIADAIARVWLSDRHGGAGGDRPDAEPGGGAE